MFASALALTGCARGPKADSALVIVLDGLRPDYVTPSLMPNLHAMAERGVFFEDHHSVFPTVTRVNASSIATGAYPATHGLMGNTVFFPEVSKEGLSASDYRNLDKVAAAMNGNLLTTKSLGEILDENGRKLLVASSGSTGSALLLNHKALGGGVINVGLVRPDSLKKRVDAVLGPVPEDAKPNIARNRWAVDAYLKLGLDEIKPDVTLMWLSDPDTTAHTFGMGAPQTDEALRKVDEEIGRILSTLRDRGLSERTNLLVTSDHGFSTHVGGGDLVKLLIENGFKQSADSDDVVVVQGGIYLKTKDREKVRRIAELLLRQDWVGAVFTESPRPGHPEGFVPGTLSFQSIAWHHDRRADLLVAPNWGDGKNARGYAGTTRVGGVAGHGSTSPHDVRATLIAAGPDFKSSERSSVPTSNVDIAPTVLHLLGIEPPHEMDGRVIREALRGGPSPDEVKVARRVYISEREDGLRLEASEAGVDGTAYFDYTKIFRP